MSETTSTATTLVVDERARFWALTALGLALTALAGGGVFASTFQWLAIQGFNDNGTDQYFWVGVSAGPLVLGGTALCLGLPTLSSEDVLARPVARASAVI